MRRNINRSKGEAIIKKASGRRTGESGWSIENPVDGCINSLIGLGG